MFAYLGNMYSAHNNDSFRSFACLNNIAAMGNGPQVRHDAKDALPVKGQGYPFTMGLTDGHYSIFLTKTFNKIYRPNQLSR